MKNRSSKWHAISIVLQESSCAAAALCRHQRFLSAQVPMLPLRDCDNAAGCPCKFRHFEDRRAGSRRTETAFHAARSQFLINNRRSSGGRRAADGL
jgi:hypothetical protein